MFIWVCTQVYVCRCISTHVHDVYVSFFICIVPAYVCACMYLCMCMHVCMYIRMHVCVLLSVRMGQAVPPKVVLGWRVCKHCQGKKPVRQGAKKSLPSGMVMGRVCSSMVSKTCTTLYCDFPWCAILSSPVGVSMYSAWPQRLVELSRCWRGGAAPESRP